MPERVSAPAGYSGFLLSMNFTAPCIASATARLAISSTSLAEILSPGSEVNATSLLGVAVIDLPGQVATASDTLAPNFLQSFDGPRLTRLPITLQPLAPLSFGLSSDSLPDFFTAASAAVVIRLMTRLLCVSSKISLTENLEIST